ncbi:MAG: hypothetical protein NVSMB6_20160 [Burkholderiaceae bacterium]
MESTSNFPSGGNGSHSATPRNDQLTSGGATAITRAAEAAKPAIDTAASSAHKTVDAVAGAVQDRTSQVHDKIDSAAAAARPAVDRLLTGAHQAVDKLSGLAAVAADTMSEKSVQLKETHAKLMASGRVQVREKPAMAIGIAVAAGFILGKIMRSR